MQTRYLGRTGLRVSELCFGTMTFGGTGGFQHVGTQDQQEADRAVALALEAGINFFDTADMYSLGESEAVLGRALAELKIPREQVVVATKVYQPMGESPNERGLSKKHIRHSIDNSLRRLALDYVDLYQIHRFDYKTPIEETLEALDAIVRAGKALAIGVDHPNYNAAIDRVEEGVRQSLINDLKL